MTRGMRVVFRGRPPRGRSGVGFPDAKELVGFVLVVCPAQQADVGRGGISTIAVGMDVIELQLTALATPGTARARERAAPAIPLPHDPFHFRRNVP